MIRNMSDVHGFELEPDESHYDNVEEDRCKFRNPNTPSVKTKDGFFVIMKSHRKDVMPYMGDLIETNQHWIIFKNCRYHEELFLQDGKIKIIFKNFRYKDGGVAYKDTYYVNNNKIIKKRYNDYCKL